MQEKLEMSEEAVDNGSGGGAAEGATQEDKRIRLTVVLSRFSKVENGKFDCLFPKCNGKGLNARRATSCRLCCEKTGSSPARDKLGTFCHF